MLKDQLKGEVGKKLGGMMGASESDMGKIIAAGLPSVLSGLGSVASSKGGADKLAEAIGSMDSSGFGDLGGGALTSGGSMLGGFLGGSVVDGLASAIAKYTGINASMVKMALGYLAPLVLGSVAASFKGAKPTGQGIAKLFEEQKSNISAAMPKGLSLESISGFQGLSGNVRQAASQATVPAESGGLGKLLVPFGVLAALAAAGFFILNNMGARDTADQATNAAASVSKAADANAKDIAAPAASGALDLAAKLSSAMGGADVLKSGMTDMMDGVFSKLEGISDPATAEAALPALKESVGKLDGFATGVGALPAEGKSIISGLIKSQLDKLNPLIEKIAAIPGIGDSIQQVLEQLKEKLTGLVG